MHGTGPSNLFAVRRQTQRHRSRHVCCACIARNLCLCGCSVEFDGDSLLVSGERMPPDLTTSFRVISQGRHAGAFWKKIPIGVECEPASLKALYRDGVLSVRVAKRATKASAPVVKVVFHGPQAQAS